MHANGQWSRLVSRGKVGATLARGSSGPPREPIGGGSRRSSGQNSLPGLLLGAFVLGGIDEAGRGPVVGPLVVAGVAVPDPSVLTKMGVTDSKALSPGKREMLDRKIRGLEGARVEVRVIAPEVLDEERKRRTLNAIEVERFQDIALALGAPTVVVDAADVDARRFGRQVASRLPPRMVVVAEHKADLNHVVVGAASIVAKVARDAAITELARRLERRLEMPLGSGYVHDPATQAFLAAWHKRFGDLPEGTRRSWATVQTMLAPKATSLDAFAAAASPAPAAPPASAAPALPTAPGA